jgi:hypothetical protein
MFSAMLFAISIVALTQFALYYWRAVLTGVAAQPVSDRVLEAANVANGRLNAADFEKLAGLHQLTPDLSPNRGGLGLVRLYYRVIGAVGSLAAARLPGLAAWSEQERALCARYAAVQIDRRMHANLAMAASMRSC